jgi:hypothetical protein
MALHQITERHKVNILGQEITYTNKFIRHTEGTSLHFKVSNSLISHASNLFKYRYEHDLLGPTLFVSSQTGKKYIMPTGQEVHPETTLKDIEWIKPVLKSIEKPIPKNFDLDENRFLRNKIEAFDLLIGMETDKDEIRFLMDKIEAFEELIDMQSI